MDRLNLLLHESEMEPLAPPIVAQLSSYLELLLKWNRQLNLTSIRTPEEILKRHFVESIFCARNLPNGITTLLDYGSGGGFPGVVIACLRSEIEVTLGESQTKKAVFLREVVRTLNLSTIVFNGRCEELSPRSFSAIALRAVDCMPEAIRVAGSLLDPGGWIVLMVSATAVASCRGSFPGYTWQDEMRIPNLSSAVLLIGQRQG